MANIGLSRLPKSDKSKQNYKYADLHVDLDPKFNISNNLFQKSEVKDLKLDYDINAVKNSLVNLFTTSPGEKILNPEFGLDLRKYLFSPANIETARMIREDIYTQIRTYEPRVKVESVSITILEDVNEFDITLKISIPELNISGVSIFGTLNSNGYIFRN